MIARIIVVRNSGAKLAWFVGFASTTACATYWLRSRRESRSDKAMRTIRKFVTATQRELNPRLRAAARAANDGAAEVTKAVAAGRKKLGARRQGVYRHAAWLLATAPTLMVELCVLLTSVRQYARADRRS